MIDLLFLTAIPLETFDQQKLEALLRNTSEAVVRTVGIQNGERRSYLFPQKSTDGFQIQCEADFLLGSSLPSFSSCSLNISKELSPKEDEHLIEIKDPQIVKSLYKAIPEGTSIKKYYSNERVYGLRRNGKYGNHFRYSLFCSDVKCELTVSTK